MVLAPITRSPGPVRLGRRRKTLSSIIHPCRATAKRPRERSRHSSGRCADNLHTIDIRVERSSHRPISAPTHRSLISALALLPEAVCGRLIRPPIESPHRPPGFSGRLVVRPSECGEQRAAHTTGSTSAPATSPHLHCPQAQVCAAAELQRGRRLACFRLPGTLSVHPLAPGRVLNYNHDVTRRVGM